MPNSIEVFVAEPAIDVFVDDVSLDVFIGGGIEVEVGGLVGPTGRPGTDGTGLPDIDDPTFPDSIFVLTTHTDDDGHPNPALWDPLANLLVDAQFRYVASDVGTYDTLTLTTDIALNEIGGWYFYDTNGEPVVGTFDPVTMVAKVSEPIQGWAIILLGPRGRIFSGVGSTTGGTAVLRVDADLSFVDGGGIHDLPDPTDPQDADTLSARETAVAAEEARAEGVEADLASDLATETADREAGDALLVPISTKGQAGGVASLDGTGKVPSSQIPAVAINVVHTASSQAAMLALSANPGDTCIRTDLGYSFQLAASPASTLSNWLALDPGGNVVSVNGQQGIVTGLAEEVDLTNEVSRAEAAEASLASDIAAETGRAETAEALLAPKAGPTFTGTVTVPDPTTNTGALNRQTGDGRYDTPAARDAAVLVETNRALAAEALKLAIASDLSDVHSKAQARLNLHVGDEGHTQRGVDVALSTAAMGIGTPRFATLGDSLAAGSGQNAQGGAPIGRTGLTGWFDKIRRKVAAKLGNQEPGLGWVPEYNSTGPATGNLFPFCWGHVTGATTAFACPGTPVPTAGIGANSVRYTTAQHPDPHTFTGNYVKRFYTKRNGGGKFQLKIDGVLDTTVGLVNTDNGGANDSGFFVEYFLPDVATGANATAGSPSTSHTIEVVVTVADVILDGGYLDNLPAGATSTVGTAQFENAGIGGAKAEDFLTTGQYYPGWVQHFTKNPPHHLTICTLGNDMNAGKTPTQFEADMKGVIDLFHAACPDSGITVVREPILNLPTVPTDAFFQSDWLPAFQRIADYADGLAGGYLWDLYPSFGNLKTKHVYNGVELVSTIDFLHPNGIVQDIMADLWLDLHAPSKVAPRVGTSYFSGDLDAQKHRLLNAALNLSVKSPNGPAIELRDDLDVFSTHQAILDLFDTEAHRAGGTPNVRFGSINAVGSFIGLAGSVAGTIAGFYGFSASGQARVYDSTLSANSKLTHADGTALTDSATLGQVQKHAVGEWGDGSDGSVSVSTTITLTRDMNYADLTVTGTGIINTAGYKILAWTSVTVNASGVIQNNGGNSSVGGAGAATSRGTLGAGTAGGTGGTTTGNPGTAANSDTLAGAGGLGGTGSSGAGGAGGAVTALTHTTATEDSYSVVFPSCFTGVLHGRSGNAAQTLLMQGGSGGGGGGGDGTVGGGGGGGGGPMLIATPNLVNNGTIRALGGNGGTPAAGNRGSGSGGGGGWIQLTYSVTSGSGTTSVAGGSPGAKTGTGTNGASGAAGTVSTRVI